MFPALPIISGYYVVSKKRSILWNYNEYSKYGKEREQKAEANPTNFAQKPPASWNTQKDHEKKHHVNGKVPTDGPECFSGKQR